MSWWVSMVNPSGLPLKGDGTEGEGGTYAIGGQEVGDLNVTYNYSPQFRSVWGAEVGIQQALHGKRAGDTVALLRQAVEQLGTERDPDYWKPTPGNAGHTAKILLGWAEANPDAIWEVH